jgi:hypothetical protein
VEAWPFNSKATVSPTEVNRVATGVLTVEGTKPSSSRSGSLPISSNHLTPKAPQVMEQRRWRIHLRRCKCLLYTVSQFLRLNMAMDRCKHQSCPSGSQLLHQMVKSITTTNEPVLRSGTSQQVCCKEFACVALSSEHLFLFADGGSCNLVFVVPV